MSGFSADWLARREPFDIRARNPSVFDAVAASLEKYSSVRIVDLASGTGSTLRALSARLPARQNWQLVDNDLGLLARATAFRSHRRCHHQRGCTRSPSRPRSRTRRAGRPGHGVRAARSRLRAMAGTVGSEDCRTRNPLLRCVKLQWTYRTRSRRSARRSHHRRIQRASAHR